MDKCGKISFFVFMLLVFPAPSVPTLFVLFADAPRLISIYVRCPCYFFYIYICILSFSFLCKTRDIGKQKLIYKSYTILIALFIYNETKLYAAKYHCTVYFSITKHYPTRDDDLILITFAGVWMYKTNHTAFSS